MHIQVCVCIQGYVCMCVCIQVYECVCVYTGVYVYIYRYMYICVFVYRCMGICVYIKVGMCVYTGVYICTYRDMFVCVFVYRCMGVLCVYKSVHVYRCLKTISSIIETCSLIGQEFIDSARWPDQQILGISCLYCSDRGIPNMCHLAENFHAGSGGQTQVT